MKRTDAEKYRFPIFRERFRELQGNMSNTEFAEFLDISRQTVGFYCNGERIPDALGLKKIAEKCNVSADWLIGLSDSCYIDVFSGLSSHLSKENDYNGDYHEIDGLSFCDADILNLRRDYATEQLESLLINTAIAAERQKEKPEVFWKRNES